MSLTSGMVNETKQASEEFADHVGKGLADLFRQLLEVLAEYRVNISIGLEKKQ